MAKPTTYATPICLVLSLLVIVGIVFGFLKHNPLIIVALLLPAVGYEVYRTEGESTRWSSWMLLLLIIAELICIIFKINYDLAKWLGSESIYAVGYYMPLGDIKIIFPVLMIIFSLILFFRTIGKYTKWLAILILVSAVATVYLIDPNILKSLLHYGTSSGLYY